MVPDSTLILVKHSLPRIDPHRPAEVWPLSPAGKLRAELLVDFINAHPEYQPVKLYSSWEQKAIETAQILATATRQQITIHPGLHEHLRRREQFSSQAHFEAQVANFFAQPQRCVFGEESADQAYQRFANAIDQILDAHPGHNLVLVTHGTVISLWAARQFGLPAYDLWHQLQLPALIVVELPQRKLRQIIPDLSPSNSATP